jgi:hypothetical protein
MVRGHLRLRRDAFAAPAAAGFINAKRVAPHLWPDINPRPDMRFAASVSQVPEFLRKGPRSTCRRRTAQPREPPATSYDVVSVGTRRCSAPENVDSDLAMCEANNRRGSRRETNSDTRSPISSRKLMIQRTRLPEILVRPGKRVNY